MANANNKHYYEFRICIIYTPHSHHCEAAFSLPHHCEPTAVGVAIHQLPSARLYLILGLLHCGSPRSLPLPRDDRMIKNTPLQHLYNKFHLPRPLSFPCDIS